MTLIQRRLASLGIARMAISGLHHLDELPKEAVHIRDSLAKIECELSNLIGPQVELRVKLDNDLNMILLSDVGTIAMGLAAKLWKPDSFSKLQRHFDRDQRTLITLNKVGKFFSIWSGLTNTGDSPNLNCEHLSINSIVKIDEEFSEELAITRIVLSDQNASEFRVLGDAGFVANQIVSSIPLIRSNAEVSER